MALRFSVSPLWETVAALRVLAARDPSPVHRRWSTWAERRLRDLGEDRSLLHALVTRPVVPEFLIPTPAVRTIDFADEVDWLPRVAKPARIAAAVEHLPHARPLLEERETALRDVQDRLRAVHEAIIAPVWPRLEGVLQGDVERRGRRLIAAGGPTVLAELHPDVCFDAPDVVVVGGVRVPIGERDLVLVPSAFVWPRPYLRDSPVRLALCYPAHGFGSLWERAQAPSWHALSRLVGRTRARLLVELDRPTAVSELAGRLGVTVGAVSQHLAVLRGAGLVVSHRQGREVVSLRTALGLALVRGEVP
ncbi:ArsR family transcriptional regulator [Actinosynnema sp. NPDC020468]|uniref:ArsR/SmtB family transcription factor n=1 Tax=Actinosynnema sp. NPDC020468 TaxID=3154488 RepID=UPI0033C30A29